MKRLLVAAFAILISAAPAWAQAVSLSPPGVKWGAGGGVQTPAPTQLIGYDSSSGQACIVGSSATCLLATGSTSTQAAAQSGPISLSPPGLKWGAGGVVTPAPVQMVGYDASSGVACIIGYSLTCVIPVSGGGGSSYTAPTIGSTLIPSGTTVTTLAGLTLTNPIIGVGSAITSSGPGGALASGAYVAAATGIGVQGGQSPSNIGDNATAFPSGHYAYQTNVNMTAARSHNLPDSVTQGVGDIEIFDAQRTVTSTNTLTYVAAGTDKLDGVTNGSGVLQTAGAGVRLHNDGAGNWTTLSTLNIATPTSAQILVANASALFVPVTSSGDVTNDNAGVWTIGANKVTLAKLATQATNTVLGNATGGTAVPTALSVGSGVFTALGVNVGSAGAFGTVGTSGSTVGLLNGTNTFSGTQTFGTVLTGINEQSGTTYTVAATDCGKTINATNGSAITITIPASIAPASGTGCNFAVRQGGAGQVSLNGTAVSAATLVSAHSYTKTFNAVGAVVGIQLTTISATATATLTGDGA